MFMVCLDNLLIAALILFGLDDWISLKDCQFLLQLEKVTLDEEILKRSQGLLCLLLVVFLG